MALVDRLRTAGIVYPRTTIAEARRAGLPLHLACALLEKESSGGRNVFGGDPTIFAGAGKVTREKYAEYKRRRIASGNRQMQGVGPCQLTWWEFQDEADREGGCWRPEVNMRVGFRRLAALIRAHGLVDGARRYNGSGDRAVAYAADFVAKAQVWQRRLAGVPVAATAGAGVSVLRRGDRGVRVERLTRRLSFVVSATTGRPYLDGKRSAFDADTEHALRAFQRDQRLRVDGVFGPRSARRLRRAVEAQKAGRPVPRPAPAAAAAAARPRPRGLEKLAAEAERQDTDSEEAWRALVAYGLRLRRRAAATSEAARAAAQAGARPEVSAALLETVAAIRAALERIERRLAALDPPPAPAPTSGSAPAAAPADPAAAAASTPEAAGRAAGAGGPPASEPPRPSGGGAPLPGSAPVAPTVLPPPAESAVAVASGPPPAVGDEPPAAPPGAAAPPAQSSPVAAGAPPGALGPAPADPSAAGSPAESPARSPVRLADLSDTQLVRRVARLERAADEARAELVERWTKLERQVRATEAAVGAAPARPAKRPGRGRSGGPTAPRTLEGPPAAGERPAGAGERDPAGGAVVTTKRGDRSAFVRRSKVALARLLAARGTEDHRRLRRALQREARAPKRGPVATATWEEGVRAAQAVLGRPITGRLDGDLHRRLDPFWPGDSAMRRFLRATPGWRAIPGQLTRNFNVSEFGCKDGTPYVRGLMREQGLTRKQAQDRAKELAKRLERVRKLDGDRPLRPSSVFRTRAYNQTLSGAAPNSAHTRGYAADIPAPAGVTLERHRRNVRKAFECGVGFYPPGRGNFVHGDFDPQLGSRDW